MRQLHASDSHGVERRREVVVRPDGSKVIRVEKRRRTYSDDQREPNRAMLKNKRFLIGLCILVLLVAGATGGIKPAHIRCAGGDVYVPPYFFQYGGICRPSAS